MSYKDRLPPYSFEAEQSVLAGLLNQPEAIGPALELFSGSGEVFYDLRNREIWFALVELHLANRSIDVVTLTNQLKTRGKLEEVGGYPHVSELPDKVALPYNLSEWQKILWEKFLARKAIQMARDTAMEVWDKDGLDEHLLGQIERRFTEFRALTEVGSIQPKALAQPADFAKGFFDQWFQRRKELAGWDMPVKLADVRIRPYELCLFTADNGAGKSTYLGHLAVTLAHQGRKVCIASLEVPCEITLWILSRQLLGSPSAFLDDTDANVETLDRALAWLNERMMLYNFLGIGNWRHILDAFRFARQHLGYDVFILDSVLKIGIPDDDYAQQTAAANAFSDFCVQTGAHLLLVVHQNKSEGKDIKRKVRGAGAWTDAAHVVLSISRNERKDEKLHALSNELRQARLMHQGDHDDEALAKAESSYENEVRALTKMHDSTLILKKQRSPAAQWQNASRHIFFDRPSLQFKEQPEDHPVNYLAVPETELPAGRLPTKEELGFV